jgi:hypothetical protein
VSDDISASIPDLNSTTSRRPSDGAICHPFLTMAPVTVRDCLLAVLLSGICGIASAAPEHVLRSTTLESSSRATTWESARFANTSLPNPARIEELKPLLRQDATRWRLYYGPFMVHGQKENVPPKKDQMDPFGIKVERKITGICTNCTVLYGKADTYYLNGSRASIATGLYNHHVLLIDSAKRTLPYWLCEEKTDLGRSKSAGFIVSGVDEAANYFTSPDGSYRSGYWIGQNQTQYTLSAEITNYREHNQTTYITAEIEFVQGKPAGYSDATISLLSVTGYVRCILDKYHDLKPRLAANRQIIILRRDRPSTPRPALRSQCQWTD